jgi:hypothetical protein
MTPDGFHKKNDVFINELDKSSWKFCGREAREINTIQYTQQKLRYLGKIKGCTRLNHMSNDGIKEEPKIQSI